MLDDDRHVQDDSELAKYAVLGHTLADLEGDLAKLRPGLKKQLLPAEKVRLEALALRAEHARMTSKEKQRHAAFLARRGYSWSLISRCLAVEEAF